MVVTKISLAAKSSHYLGVTTGTVRSAVSVHTTLDTPTSVFADDEALVSVKNSQFLENLWVYLFQHQPEVPRSLMPIPQVFPNSSLHGGPELYILRVIPSVGFFKPAAKMVMVVRVYYDVLTPVAGGEIQERASVGTLCSYVRLSEKILAEHSVWML
jgi:hypothetical protein